MFTGIIEETGTVLAITRNTHSAVLRIAAKTVLEDARRGDSIAVNGVCLTVTSRGADEFTADVMHETLDRSSLGELRAGSRVNLERALRLDGRLGGHIVTGHIDGTGRIQCVRRDANAIWYTIATELPILNGIVEKGSIAVDGISLTVAKVTEDDFSVSLIPHTAAHTTLSGKREGAVVNLETDCIGKYVAKLFGAGTDRIGNNRTSPFGAGTDHIGNNRTSPFGAGTDRIGTNRTRLPGVTPDGEGNISLDFLTKHGFG